jgi:hypothetical protein
MRQNRFSRLQRRKEQRDMIVIGRRGLGAAKGFFLLEAHHTR